MFHRQKTYLIYEESGKTRNDDVSKALTGFAETGVHFCIHVIYKDEVTIARLIQGKEGEKPAKILEKKHSSDRFCWAMMRVTLPLWALNPKSPRSGLPS